MKTFTKLIVIFFLLFSYQTYAMPITYGVTVSNEDVELDRLLKQLKINLDEEDKILVQVDKDSHTDAVLQVIDKYKKLIPLEQFNVIFFPLNNDFGAFKTNLLKNAGNTGFIFQLDADEVLSPSLMQNFKFFVEKNKDADIIYVPRANYYINTDSDPELDEKYKKSVDELGRYNYPDWQGKLMNLTNQNMSYQGKMHENIIGAKKTVFMPNTNKTAIWDLLHIKTLQKQKNSDKLYHKIGEIIKKLG